MPKHKSLSRRFEPRSALFQESRMNDFYYLNLDTWEWNEMCVLRLQPRNIKEIKVVPGSLQYPADP